MCYSGFAPESVIQTIIKLLDSIRKLSESILLENDTKPPIPLDIFFTAINGEGDYIGKIIGYDYGSNETLDILVTCRGNGIIPFRDTLLDLFPEIT